MDIQLLESQITGLEQVLTDLRAAKDKFTKVQGLHESIEKQRKEAGEYEAELAEIKKELAGLQSQKAEALQATAEALSTKMSQILPEGRAVLEISDEGVEIAWIRPDGVRVPYSGLSGGQRGPFDMALSFALLGDGPKVLVLEAAELDPVNLQRMLNHLAQTPEDCQVIVNAWQSPAGEVPGWKVEVVK